MSGRPHRATHSRLPTRLWKLVIVSRSAVPAPRAGSGSASVLSDSIDASSLSGERTAFAFSRRFS
uniref:Uncharacterized protein n=1 Tax=Peronospora matthiolae TaxID=2874970 RepID=A0AAV1VL52_9STRA